MLKLMSALITALLCALVGGLLVGADYARKGKKPLLGVAIGADLAAAIGLILFGGLGIFASGQNDDLGTRLTAMASLALGLLLMGVLSLFEPVRDRDDRFTTATQAALRALGGRLAGSPPAIAAVPVPPLHAVPDTPGMIFISYRRDDSLDVCGRLYDYLVNRYTAERVFKDVDSIPFGVDFREHLRHTLENCDVVLAVVGDRWLNIARADGSRRLDDPADFVRVELEIAFERGVRVVPVLVKGAAMPAERDLPPTLQRLAFRNGIAVRYDPDFHNDMARLVRSLESFQPSADRAPD